MNTTATIDQPNTHITAEALQAALGDELDRLEQLCGTPVTLEPLGKLKTVADATTKFLLRTQAGHPVAVIVCARPIATGLVQRGTNTAEAIRAIIGDNLGRAIIKPISSGTVDGRSYVILPYCRDFSSWRPRRILQRLRIQRPMLTWLREATARAAQSHGPASESTVSAYSPVLEHLEREHLFDRDIQAGIQHALHRLESGAWRPRHTFDHNDLYLSNIMLPVKFIDGSRPHYPFMLIDWAGANAKGFGIYDLVRLARAFNLSDRSLHRELVGHAAALECDIEDTPGHLLAALGRLHQHIEHFPLDKYISTVQACWRTIKRGMSVRDEAT